MSAKHIAIREVVRATISDSVTRPNDTTQYAAGDVLGDVTGDAHFEFQGVVQQENGGGSGEIIGANLIISADESGTLLPDCELWLFDTDIAARADNATFIPTDAAMLNLIAVIDFPVADFKVGLSGGNVACRGVANNFPIDYGPLPKISGNSIYGVLVYRNAYTPAASEVYTIRLMTRQNP